MSEYDYFSGDPKRLWQDQIAGIIDMDHSDFIGALTDLLSDPDWQLAFAAIKDAPGMPEFLDRVQQHFDFCRSPHDPDGSVNPYQHPSRTYANGAEKDPDAMTGLMRRHLDTVAKALETVYDGDCEEETEVFRQLEVRWTDDWASVNTDPYAQDGRPAKISIFEALCDIEGGCEKDDIPQIVSCIREACYGLAADFDLSRYLMQGFYDHDYDVDAIYELNWKHGCSFYFDESACYVYDAAARAAATP